MRVKYEMVCDRCHAAAVNVCKGCYRDLCRACEEPGTANDETGRAMCRDCAGYAIEGMR